MEFIQEELERDATREEMKSEAVERLKAFGIYSDAISQFSGENKVMTTEPPLGALYWLDEEQAKRVAEFESEYNALVYMVIKSYTGFGELESYLYVGNKKSEWEADRNDAEIDIEAKGTKMVFAYVNNLTYPSCSKFGSICVQNRNGGLIRVC